MEQEGDTIANELALSRTDSQFVCPFISFLRSDKVTFEPDLSEVLKDLDLTREEEKQLKKVKALQFTEKKGSSPRSINPKPPFLDMYEIDHRVVTRYAWPAPAYRDVLRDAHRVSAPHNNLSAKVALSLEPLKCRVITKGEALPYHLSQTFQKHAWQSLQGIPAMALTGRPMVKDDLSELVRKTRKLDLDFNLWVSGDYSAATDGLSLEVNQLCLGSYLDSCQASPAEKEICMKVLGPHLVSYPDSIIKSNPDLDLAPFVMTNGQLMGRLLSFPVLCTINVAAYWVALEKYTGRTFTRDELPVLVNGDDIVFLADKGFYEVWKREIEVAGFNLSLGKNYISPHFVTVNSQGYVWQKDGSFQELKALNTGLLLERAQGPQKIAMRDNLREKPIGGKLQGILDGANNPVRAFDRMKHHRKEDIATATCNGYWNLASPAEFGGLGLRLPDGVKSEIYFTATQQLIAGAALAGIKEHEGELCRDFPKTGYERVSVQEKTKEVIPVAENKPGYLRLRKVEEPDQSGDFDEAEGARQVAPGLLNCQEVTIGSEPPEFSYKPVSKKRINAAYQMNRKVKTPFTFPYRITKNGGPTDDVSSLCSVTENMTEMATETICPVLVW